MYLMDCNEGCICNKGYLRISEGGECVPKEDCPWCCINHSSNKINGHENDSQQHVLKWIKYNQLLNNKNLR